MNETRTTQQEIELVMRLATNTFREVEAQTNVGRATLLKLAQKHKDIYQQTHPIKQPELPTAPTPSAVAPPPIPNPIAPIAPKATSNASEITTKPQRSHKKLTLINLTTGENTLSSKTDFADEAEGNHAIAKLLRTRNNNLGQNYEDYHLKTHKLPGGGITFTLIYKQTSVAQGTIVWRNAAIAPAIKAIETQIPTTTTTNEAKPLPPLPEHLPWAAVNPIATPEATPPDWLKNFTHRLAWAASEGRKTTSEP